MLYRPFFYWVHRTLPLVYDDSLSYMELLSKVLYHLNKDTEKINEMSKLLEQLTNFIQNYFDSADFEQLVSDKLDEMAEDGTLDLMLSEIAASSKFVPTDAEHNAYVSGVAAAIVDWFGNMARGTCDSVVGNSTTASTKYAAAYNDNYSVIYPNLMTYDAIVDNLWTFGKLPDSISENNYDSATIGGLTYPVMYMNCAGFLTMLTKGRGYSASPWLELFNNSSATGKNLAARCMEFGDMDEAPWTFDFMNVLLTWRMASVMKGSGCTPKLIASKSAAGEVSYTDDLKYLRDGDILFFGNPANDSYEDRYLAIHHCAMYFKTLDALNDAAAQYGFTFKPWNSATSVEQGYFVHCTTSSSGSYQNVLRVDTLADWLSRANNYEAVYGCQVSANALNSSKEFCAATGTMPLYNCEIRPGPRRNWASNDLDLDYNTVRAYASGTNNGSYSYGQYRYAQPRYTVVSAAGTFDLNDYVGPKMSGTYVVHANNVVVAHGPTSAEVVEGEDLLDTPNSTAMQLQVQDCYQSDGLTLQTLTLVSVTPHKWERTINSSGNSSKWYEIF